MMKARVYSLMRGGELWFSWDLGSEGSGNRKGDEDEMRDRDEMRNFTKNEEMMRRKKKKERRKIRKNIVNDGKKTR
jgi:hypothetical protein